MEAVYKKTCLSDSAPDARCVFDAAFKTKNVNISVKNTK